MALRLSQAIVNIILAKTLTTVELAVQGCVIIMCVGGAGHYMRSICIDEHHYGHKIGHYREVAAKPEILEYYSEWRCSGDQGEWPL